MKKILLFASALAGLFLAGSCQRENLEPMESANTVTYTVTVPDALATKGIGDVAPDAMVLHYEVYRTTGQNDAALGDDTRLLYHDTATIENGTTTLDIELVNDQNFTVLFWAEMENNGVYNSGNLKNVTLATTAVANQEAYAAFTGVDFIKKGDELGNRNVSLIRPLAQVNVATTPESLTQFDTDITIRESAFTVSGLSTTFNVATQTAGTDEVLFTYESAEVLDAMLKVNDKDYKYVSMNYVGFAPAAGASVVVTYAMTTSEGVIDNEIQNVPVKANYRTNIIGNLISESANYTITLDTSWDAEYNVENGNVNTNTYVANADEFKAAFEAAFADEEDNNMITLSEDINLNDLISTRTTAVADPSYTLTAGKTLTIDLNGKKLSATSAQVGKNYNMFDVRGTLTVKNGTIEYEHLGENMGWGSSTNIFNVTAGGVLNLKDITAKNLGGSDMGFVAHLNNWGEVTLNAENCTLESNYVPVRVFNSGYDMNNVTIKNSTLKGNSAAFWVHNYTVEDFGSAEKADAQKALLNLSIYDQGNTFSPDVNGVRYGFTNSVRSDAYGITKTVSEDGSVVTLGSVVENGLVRRGVAGTEENTTITKAIVGEGITTLYDRTFRRFYALETVELPSTLTTIGAAGSGVFQSCTALKNIVIPESVTVIGKGTFQECSSLESINIPAGVTRIEADALRATGLVSVEFHEGVTYFGAQAFRDCKQLKEVVIKAPKFTIEANAFGSMAAPYPAVTIYVANTEMRAYLESTLTYANQFDIVVPGLVNDAEEFKAALADTSKDIITLAAGVTYEGVFEINRGVEIVSESADNKAIIKGRVNVKGDAVTDLSFTNVAFAVNNDSKVVWTSGGSFMKQKPSIIMAEANYGEILFNNCDFALSTSAYGYTNTSSTKTIFNNCSFNGEFNYAMYVRANIEVTNCVYNTTVTNVLVGACVNALENGKVVFVNNSLPTGESISLAGAIVFTSSNNNAAGEWAGPVEFTVKNNPGFTYAYERMGDFIVNPDNHTFTEGSERFSF